MASKVKPGFRELPFSLLIERDQRLVAVRQEYAQVTAEARAAAADWAYHAACADDLFGRVLAAANLESASAEGWPPGVEALAIDPTFAPALLTVGAMEYQLGRKAEARVLFHGLLTLAKDTPDLEEIVDKAGTFLLDASDVDEAHQLYEAACAVFPESARLLSGLGYTLGKLGRRSQSVAIHRRALLLAPNDSLFLSDLGWALAENNQFEEAEKVLQEAVALAPSEDELPRNNLEEVRRRSKGRKRRAEVKR